MKLFRSRRANRNAVDAVASIEASRAEVVARGQPDLQGAARPMAPGAKAFLVLIMTLSLGAIAVVVWRMSIKDDSTSKFSSEALEARVQNILPPLKLEQRTSPAPPPPPAQESATSAVAPLPEEPSSRSSTASRGPLAALSLGQEQNERAVDDITARRLGSTLRGERDANEASGQVDTQAAATEDVGPMAGRLQGMDMQPARASMLRNRDFLLAQGAVIGCTLLPRLVTAQAGMLTCQATQSVLSSNGRVVLIDPGTIFTGYQQAVLAQGQPRIAVVWTRMESPKGVRVTLNSPGTGALGEAGLDGHIDTHFAERFGGAIMVSLISDFGQWASGRNRSDSDTFRFDNTSDAAQDAVTTVLENTINIPPTLYRNQGTRVAIYVARDLDFSTVYTLKPVRR